MTAASIRREITRDGDTVRYVFSFCTACAYWNAFEFSLTAAFGQGERHLINVHGATVEEASTARRQHEHKQKAKAVEQTTNHEIRRHDA